MSFKLTTLVVTTPVYAAMIGVLAAISSSIEGGEPLLPSPLKPVVAQEEQEDNRFQVPCTDEKGYPDLIVDQNKLQTQWRIEEKTFDSQDCDVVEESVQDGDRVLLRLTLSSPNLGPGDLVLGSPAGNPDLFEDALCHKHKHLEGYAEYRLWSQPGYSQWIELRADHPNVLGNDILKDNPKIADEMESSVKRAFCLIDRERYEAFYNEEQPTSSSSSKYNSCEDNQGISVGYADTYGSSISGQWIDITIVEPGLYVLEAEVNPERFFEEANYDNNSAAVIVTIPPRTDRDKL